MGKLERTEIWVLKKFLYIQIHSSIIYNSPNREILQVSTDRWLYNIISWTQNGKYTQVVAVHTFNPCMWEAKAGGSVSSKPVCSTKRVPGLHAEKQANKQDKYYAILIKWIQIHRIQKEKADHQRWEGEKEEVLCVVHSFSFTRKSSGDNYTAPCDQCENACFVFSLVFLRQGLCISNSVLLCSWEWPQTLDPLASPT